MPRFTFRCETCLKLFTVGRSKPRAYCSQRCAKTKHGGEGTRLYKIWIGMRSRCFCETNPNFNRYGGRGITVCNEWNKSFIAFRKWSIINGYNDDLEIDRRDNDGNYEPSNCRWATCKQQIQNQGKRSTPTTSRFKGVYWNKQNKRWIARFRLGEKYLCLGKYTDEIEAAQAYDRMAIEHQGEYAHPNFNHERVAP